MSTRVTSIGVGKLSSTDLYVDKFLVEIYSDAGFTTRIGQATAAATWNGTQWEQKELVMFDGLTFGTTYFLRATTVAPISGVLGAWSTFSLVAGSATPPNPTYTLVSKTASFSGVTYVVSPVSAPIDLEHYEWTYTVDGSTPTSTTKPKGIVVPDPTSGNLVVFAGATSSQSVLLYLRAVNTSQQVQAWTAPTTGTNPLANIIDNMGDGVYLRIPNAPTNRNLVPDSGFKTWNSNTLYWVPSSWVLLPGLGADGGNAIGYLGTGSPSGFPEAGLRKNPILLAPGNYTLSAYMDATFVTSSVLDMGLYLSVGSSGTPTALDGGPFHNTQTAGQKGRKFTNFTVAIRTWTASTAFAANDLVVDTHGNLQAVITAGTSGGSTPSWSTVLGNNTTDGTATWKLINLAANMLGGTKVPFNMLMFPSNATVTSGKYAIISNPQLEVTPPSNTPTPYQENPGDDASGTMLVDLSNTNHGSFKVSTLLNSQGSIVPGQAFSLSWSTTSTSISFSWSAASLLRADGSSLSVSAGTQSYSSPALSPSTQYWFYPYIDAATGVVGFANGNPPPTSSSNTLAIQAAFDGRIALLPFSVTTPASGMNSGSGGDGSCPDSNELVEVQGRGIIKASDVEFGDYIKGYSFENQQDVFRRVIGKGVKSCAAWRIVEGHKVSPCEPVYLNDQWISASRVPGAGLDTSIGIKMDLVVEADDFDQHNYWLVGGTPLLIHNPVLPRS